MDAFWSLWFPSIMMGIGIAIDVAIATISKFQDRSLSFRNWTFPIMCTHIGFPAFGYYGFWGLRHEFPALSPVLGVVGCLFVVLFVYEVVCKAIYKKPIFGISSWVSEKAGLDENDTRRFIAILAVSWDALWSGPAKAAQAAAENWTNWEVFVSFPVAGLTVAIVAQLSLMIAGLLQRQKYHSVSQMAGWFSLGKYVELSVIGGFGVLSLMQASSSGVNLYWSIAIAAVILGLVWARYVAEVADSSHKEALKAIEATEGVEAPAAA